MGEQIASMLQNQFLSHSNVDTLTDLIYIIHYTQWVSPIYEEQSKSNTYSFLLLNLLQLETH